MIFSLFFQTYVNGKNKKIFFSNSLFLHEFYSKFIISLQTADKAEKAC